MYSVPSKGFTDYEGLFEIEGRLDQIILKAHKIYVQAREKIMELKVNENNNKTYSLRKLSGEA